MQDRSYPAEVSEVEVWSERNQVPAAQGRARFMEYVILNCIASNATTRGALVLKGGNALRFAYESPRSTKDLDFTAVGAGITDNPDLIRKLLDQSLTHAFRRFNVKAKSQRVTRNPKSAAATRPTYDIAIGYQWEGDRYFADFARRDVPTVIPVEITLNDLACDTHEWPDMRGLRVCSLEDILAEKLRSLLQQKIRNRNRWQDAYDIGAYIRKGAQLDRGKVARFLLEKSRIREIDARKSSFDEEVRERAAREYQDHVATQAPQGLCLLRGSVASSSVLGAVAGDPGVKPPGKEAFRTRGNASATRLPGSDRRQRGGVGRQTQSIRLRSPAVIVA